MNSVVSTFPMGSSVLDQQLGCLWQKDHLLSISLSGYINYLDKNNPSKPLRVIKVRLTPGYGSPVEQVGKGPVWLGKGATKAKWKLERRPRASSALKVLAEGLDTGCFSGTCLAEVGGQMPSPLELL